MSQTSRSEAHDDGAPGGRAWVGDAAAGLIAVLAVVLVLAQTRNYGLLGFDTYPAIITSKVRTAGDFVGNFTERLMDGRYPAAFYRPAFNLTFALDEAVWGLNPVGYHLTNAVLFGAGAAALFFLTRRLTGPRSWVAPFAAMLFFVLHPSHWEVLPVPARRADLMCCLAVTLSLLMQVRACIADRHRFPIWPAVLMLAAVASKETALLFPAVSFLVVLLYANAAGFRQRLVRALLAMVPHAVAVGLMVSARIAILGGMGGHDGTRTLWSGVAAWPGIVGELARLLALPRALAFESKLGVVLVGGFAICLPVTAFLVARQRRRGGFDGLAGLWRAAAVAAGWLGVLTAAYAASADVVQPWYLYLAVAGVGLLFGVTTEALTAVVHRGEPARQVAALCTLVILLLWALGQARYSPLVHRYGEWARATEVADGFLARLRAEIDAAPAGSTVVTPPIPAWLDLPESRTHLAGVAVIDAYSLQAWADLTYPDRRVSVCYADNPRHPASDEVVVMLTGRLFDAF